MKIYNVTFRDIRNIASWTIEELQDEIEKVRSEKKRLSAEMKYDFVALLRDREKELDLEIKRRSMEITNIQSHLKCFDKFHLKEFFEKVFKQFEKELNQIQGKFYKKEDSVFDQIEMTWVGVFNNAIIKAFPKEATTLIEYAVYDEKEFKGRADLLVRWGNVYLYFEAKRDSTISKVEKLEGDVVYTKVDEQLRKYSSSDKGYLPQQGSTVYLISIFFGRIHKEEVLNKAQEVLQPKSLKEEYSILYRSKTDGAWIYGKVEKLK